VIPFNVYGFAVLAPCIGAAIALMSVFEPAFKKYDLGGFAIAIAFLAGVFLSGIVSALTDRCPKGGVLASYRELASSFYNHKPMPPGSRIAVFLAPLVFSPWVFVFCTAVMWAIDLAFLGRPHAPASLYLVTLGLSLLASLGLLGFAYVTRNVRDIRSRARARGTSTWRDTSSPVSSTRPPVALAPPRCIHVEP